MSTWKTGITGAVIGVILIFLGATGIKVLHNMYVDSANKGDPWPSPNPDQAKQQGNFVCDVTIRPMTLEWRGQKIVFHNAWIEEAVEPAHFLVWFPYYRRVGGYYLCFTLEKGNDVISQFDLSFVVEGRTDGFGTLHPSGNIVYFRDLKDINILPIKMSLVPSLNAQRLNNIVIRCPTRRKE
jgi:hypothetical protein